MAIFGVPFAMEAHAEQAIMSALGCSEDCPKSTRLSLKKNVSRSASASIPED
jgi:hypothetical protein